MPGSLMLLNAFTWSQAKDNGAGSLENPNGNVPGPQDFYNREAYALSAYNQPLNNTTNFVWDLPFGRGRRRGGDASAQKPDLRRLTVARRGHPPLLDEPECVAAIDAFLATLP